jgi:hypothetical protein
VDCEVIEPVERGSLPPIPAQAFLGIVRGFFVVWGTISFLAAILIVGFIAYKTGLGNREKIDRASAQDVAYVLNWAQLGAGRIEKVIHSYQSARSPNGDHLEAYAILINKVDLAELTKPANGPWRWHRGDELPPVIATALDFVHASLGDPKISWFPRVEELKSADFYVYAWKIEFHGDQPAGAQLIFVRPSERMVYYISVES